jgi:hypothetical protein
MMKSCPVEDFVKLLFTWLLGVPALVLAMVLARALSPHGLQAAQRAPAVVRAPAPAMAASTCPRQDQVDPVRSLVAKDGKRIACDRRTVQ